MNWQANPPQKKHTRPHPYKCLPLHPLLSSDNINLIWFSLKSIIYSGMNLFIPKVKLRKYQYPNWFTPELHHLSKCVRTLRKRISKRPSAHNQRKLSELEDSLRHQIQTTKSSHEVNLIRSFAAKSTNKIYDYIRSLSSNNLIPQRVQFGTLSATSDYDRASLFNQFFSFRSHYQLLQPSTNGELPSTRCDDW